MSRPNQSSQLEGLASLSSPKEWLNFVLANELSSRQVQVIGFSFIKKFPNYLPNAFSFSNIQLRTPQAKEELVSLIARSANNFEKGD